MHLLTNVGEYDPKILSKKRRRSLRTCRKRTKIVQLTGRDVLQEQGYAVVASALDRTRHTQIPARGAYLADLAEYIDPARQLVLAGLVGDQLVAYLVGHGIGRVAYMDRLYIATEALTSGVGTGLVVGFVQACRRSGKIDCVVYGLHSREHDGLCRFKEGMRFPVTHVPAMVRVNPIMARFLQWRYPHKYYRLRGTETNGDLRNPTSGSLALTVASGNSVC